LDFWKNNYSRRKDSGNPRLIERKAPQENMMPQLFMTQLFMTQLFMTLATHEEKGHPLSR